MNELEDVKEVTGQDRRTYVKKVTMRAILCLECDCLYDKHVQTWTANGNGNSWCGVCKRYCYRIVGK